MSATRLAVGLFCLSVVFGDAGEVAKEVSVEEALRIGGDFLQVEPDSLEFVRRSTGTDREGGAPYYVLRTAEGTLCVDAAGGLVISYDPDRLLPEAEVVLSLDEARRRASRFFRFAESKLGGTWYLDGAELLDHGVGCVEYVFTWRQRLGDVETANKVTVNMRPDTGGLNWYSVFRRPLRVPTSPTVTAQAALDRAGQEHALERPEVVLGPRLAVRVDPGNADSEVLVWRIKRRGLHLERLSSDSSRYVPQEVETWVDAHTGEVCCGLSETLEDEQWRELARRATSQLPGFHPRRRHPCDYWPSWMGAGELLFESAGRPRVLEQGPDGKEREKQVAVLATTDFVELRRVLDMPTWGPIHASRSPQGQFLAFSIWENTYTLGLRTGAVECHTTKERPGEAPAWSPDGKWLAIHARRSQGDQDIFVIDVERSLKAGGQWRVAKLPGEDRLPVFRPDGEYLAFAHMDPVRQGQPTPAWAIYLVKAAKPYWDNDPPENIMEGLGYVRRMSWFPDNRRLLVWHGDQLDVVDTQVKSKQPLGLPELYDPDFRQGKPLQVNSPVVDPTGTRIAFSGVRWSGDPDDPAGAFIYTCNLDGSDLKRITPLEDDPIPPYIFPETGKSALDLAKEIALEEVRQNDR